MKKSKPMTKKDALFLLIAGLIMGTVFTFGMQYWNAPITQDEAIHTDAVFLSYKEQRGNGYIKEIIVQFEDHEQLYIDGACISQELVDKINTITPGTAVSIIFHPHSDTIMQMCTDTVEVLEFEDSVRKLDSEAGVFFYLGIFCYIMAGCGLIGFLFRKR